MQAPYSAPPGKPAKPLLVRFLVKHATIGFAMALLFVAAMMAFNVGNMTSLIVQSDVGLFALALLTVMIGLTFASLQMGFAVMFASDQIGLGGNHPGDPLIAQDDMNKLGLRPMPIKSRSNR